MFLDRSRTAGRHLEWKVRAFSVGAVLGLAGIYFRETWMTGAAIAVLALAVLMRAFSRPAEGDEDPDRDPEEDTDPEPDEAPDPDGRR